MGDSGRRRSSMWDVEEDNQPFTSRGRRREYSPSGVDNSMRSKAHSGWTSWEDKVESIPKDKDIAETRERGEKTTYYKNMSPGFDGLAQQNWSHSPDNKLSQSHRYTGRGRSRSRSREKGRGREKTRSRSCSWSRGRNKGRGWSKSRSRSRDRSRSRSRGSARGETRSRSPFHDQGGRDSYGWNGRKSGSGRLSQICRDFSTGMCRRGSQCRFFHPDNADHREDNYLEAGQSGRLRSKPEPGRISRYQYDKPYHKFSDAEDEPLRNRSRGTIPCIDFMKGNCRFGGSCRFLHHTTQNDNYDRGLRNTSVDPDERRQKRPGKTLCKFFLAGKCQRDNCRFSHDAPTSNDLEDRSRDNNGGQIVGDLTKRRNDPMWDDTKRFSNIRTESRWGEAGGANMDLTEEASVDRRSGGRWDQLLEMESKRWGPDLENESKGWGRPEHNDNGFNRDTYHTSYCENDNSGEDVGTAQAVVIENPFGEQGEHQFSQNIQSQNVERFSSHQSRNLTGEASSHYLSTTRPNISMNSGIRQYQGLAEHSSAKVLGSEPLHELNDSGNTNPDNKSSFFERSVLNGTDQGQHMLSPTSNEHNVGLNKSVHNIGSPLTLQIGNQNHQQEVTTAVMLESNVTYSLPAAVPSEHVATMTTPPTHLTQNLVYELKPQLHTVSYASNSMSVAPYPNTAHPLPTNYTLNIIKSVRGVDQYTSDNNGSEHATSRYNEPLPGNSSYSIEIENQKSMELASSFSINNPTSDKIDPSGGSEVDYDPKLNLNVPDKKFDLDGNDKLVDGQGKDVDGQGKDEGGNGNKDDKGMRLFKNALIEFVKEILKPTWKEGKLSREVHKSIVKKVVDKVTSSIQGEHVPKTQEKIEQYLSSSKPKISKLAQAYVERSQKTES